MRKYILLSLASALFFLNFQCDEDGVVVDFNYTFSDIEFPIEPIPVVGEQTLSSVDIDLKIDSVFAANNISKETLQGAKINAMTFAITVPATANFNDIDYIETYISAPSAGLAEVYVAKTPDPMPKDVQSVEMVVDGADIAQYVKAGIISLTVKGKNNDTIDEKMTIKCSITFTISGKVL